MSGKSATSDQLISLPKGGGALSGIGEKFSPDLHTGTGNFSIPLELPSGRNGFQPKLQLAYSTGAPNGPFGLGWTLGVPAVTRKTSKGIPRYDDGVVFILSGAEDLVDVGPAPGGGRAYRPRTEGLFAQIVHRVGAEGDHWEVRTKDGLTSVYSATVSDSDGRIFAWHLTQTTDTFGNRIEYRYARDDASSSPQLYLRSIRYVDYGDDDFLVTIALDYAPRPDPFSDYRPGFELRTTLRCRSIEVRTHGRTEQRARVYHLTYADERHAAPNAWNDVSLLSLVQLEGVDGDGRQSLPPLELGYTLFEPERHRYRALTAEGNALPERSLASREYELVDLFGNGLPSVLQMNGSARYWRNRGNGRFDAARTMRTAPAGVSLADTGVQIADLDGDSRPDLLVTAGPVAGYHSLNRSGGWDRRFRRYAHAPAVNLESPDVRLVDLTGDGIVDALRTGPSFELYYNEGEDWERVQLRRRGPPELFPDVSFADPRVKLAAMTGDGLQSIVLVHDGRIDYWPYMGYGRWGRRVTMKQSPRLRDSAGGDYDPKRLLLGDVDGDGCADLVYVGADKVTIWINQSGNGWSEPITIRATPTISDLDAVRLADLDGTGTGILWTYDSGRQRVSTYKFLNLTGGHKPYLLNRIDNHIGATTEIEYASSTRFYLEDERSEQTRWKTQLPFPVHVVASVRATDAHPQSTLTTDYSYHHGYWDGVEREFRGFARVEQRDAEVVAGATAASAPIERRTWFHLGPIGSADDGGWEELDLSGEYWQEDKPLVANLRLDETSEVLARLPTRTRRDAVRTLAGRILRSEVYALDRSPRAPRPFTVTETIHSLRTEDAERRIFFPFVRAERTTHWERGREAMTSLRLTGDHDAFGQAQSEVMVAVPRASSPEARYLATRTVTKYAKPDGQPYPADRLSRTTTDELSGTTALPPLPFALAAERMPMASDAVISDTLTFYDGTAFVGLESGKVGRYGAVTRTETLVLTAALAKQAYGTQMPPYLGPDGALQPTSDYPAQFCANFPKWAGYKYYGTATPDGRFPGYYAVSDRRQYDFQRPDEPPHGLVRVLRDPLDRDTTIDYDPYGLLAVRVANASKLTEQASYDERVLKPARIVDVNDNITLYRYTPLGLVASVARLGKGREADWGDKPSQLFVYDLNAFDQNEGQPISVLTANRERHPWELPAGSHFPPAELDDFPERFVQLREYSDGMGRLLQTRSQADAVAFGNPRFGDAALPVDQTKPAGDAIGVEHTNAKTPRVVVSGWQVYDNKGHVVERFEPFFANGWEYAKPTADDRRASVKMRYDTLGRLVETTNPDGSQQAAIYGVPGTIPTPNLNDPATFEPTPWVSYTYDANDNAGRTHPTGSAAYATHWNTPSSAQVDALGRVVQTIERTDRDAFSTSSSYDIRGNLLAFTDALGRPAYSCIYDLLNRPLRTTQLDCGTKLTVLDAAGNTIETRDAKGALVLTRFDELNRLTRRWARDRTGESMTLRERVIYGDETDAALPSDPKAANLRGRLYRSYDEAGLLECRAYDFDGNLIEKARQVISDAKIVAAQGKGDAKNWSNVAFRVDWTPPAATPFPTHATSLLDPTVYLTSSSYDALGRVRSVLHPQGADTRRRLTTLSYGRGGALNGVQLDGDVYVEGIAYNARGQRILITYGNGVMTRYAYDKKTFRLARLRSERYIASGKTYRGSGAALQDLGYGFDLVGNALAVHDRTPGCGVGTTPNRLDRAFGYDPLHRLTSATGRETGATPTAPWSALPREPDPNTIRAYSETYAYDKVGNLQSLAHTGAPTRRMTLGVGNRLATLTLGTTPTPRTYRYAYDASGNMLREQTRRLEWDHGDRLQSFRVQPDTGPPSIYLQFHYDASGQRVKKIVRTGGSDLTGTIETTIYIDGFEAQRVVTLANTNAPRVQENTSLHLIDGWQRIAHVRFGPALQKDATPAVKYHLGDHLGSSTLVLDEKAAWINREEYTPYGDTSYGGIARKRYRFSGRERDGESGFYYHGARYYAPWIARWTSCDPLGIMSGTQSMYEAMANNPLRFTDPQGMNTVSNPWEDAVEGSKMITGAIHEGSVAVGDAIVDATSEAAAELRQQGHPWLAAGVENVGIIQATLTSTALEVIGQTLAAGPNAVLALQTGGESIAQGAFRIANAEDPSDAVLGTLEILAGAGQGAQAALTFLPGARPAGPRAPAPGPVPGRVASRINLAEGSTRFTPSKATPSGGIGAPVKAGMEHVRAGHVGGPRGNSQFLVEPGAVLGKPQVVGAPPRPLPLGDGVSYVRQVELGTAIGRTRGAEGTRLTNALRIQTDAAGNVITAYSIPGWRAEFNIQVSAAAMQMSAVRTHDDTR
jgi:RHS repeat-associated protein